MIFSAAQPNDLKVIHDSIVDSYKIVADKGSRILKGVPERVADRGMNQDQARRICDAILNATQSKFFSDTMVVSLSLDSFSAVPSIKSLAVGFFFCHVKSIAYTLMRKGFPIRGCIDSGSVISGEKLVVGTPYVKSLHFSERLEFSGVVVTEPAEKLYECTYDSLKKICPLINLQIPVKGGYVDAVCVNWLPSCEKTSSDVMQCGINDIEQVLYEKFSANGKVMGESAISKLRNTAMTIRAFLAQNKSLS